MRRDGQKNVLLLSEHSHVRKGAWKGRQEVRNSPGSHVGIARRESEQGPAGSGVGTVSHGNEGAES